MKETKAQRIERIKRLKNPWDGLQEIESFSHQGFQSIPDEWLNTYFRWWGVYTQGDGDGVRGKAVQRFMVRIRIPNGYLNALQLKTIADLATLYGKGFADITVRQNIQLHWVSIEDMPHILRRLFEVGLTTKASCGDDTRNITGCPLAGIDQDEITDASLLVHAATQMLTEDSQFYNLPRKFKVCITGCRVWCSYPEINDVGFTAVERDVHGKKETGFSVRVGGGLSVEPHFAVRLNAFVPSDQVLPVLKGIAQIFRDSNVLREDRSHARLKHLFLIHGWTDESFQKELEERIGFRLEPAAFDKPPERPYRDHVGIHRQKQPGYYYAGFAVARGRVSAHDLEATAEWSQQYGNGFLRTTNMQNLIIVNLPEEALPDLTAATSRTQLKLSASPFLRGLVACTGTEYCKLAISETKSLGLWLAEELQKRMPDYREDLKINVNGCPNSCGQLWIADIGLQGCKVHGEDGFDFLIGGGVGKSAAFARRVGYRATAKTVPEAIEKLLNNYLILRSAGESFRNFCARHTEQTLRIFLAGTDVPAEAQPEWPGPPPHGVEG